MTHDEERAAITALSMGVLGGLLLSAAVAYLIVGICLLIGATPWPALAVGTSLLIIEVVLYMRNRKDIRWAGQYAKEQLRRMDAARAQKERERQVRT